MGLTENLLAMDPGLTTGWAHFIQHELVDQGTIGNGVDGAVEWLHSGNRPRYRRLVLESFIPEPDFVGRAHASEVIGAMVGDAYLLNAPYSFQSRAQKRLIINGDETKRFRFLREHGFEGSSHELDAISHGLIRQRLEGNALVVKRYWGKKKPLS